MPCVSFLVGVLKETLGVGAFLTANIILSKSTCKFLQYNY